MTHHALQPSLFSAPSATSSTSKIRRAARVELGETKAQRAETKLVLCPGQVRRLEALAEMSYPFEACGLLVGDFAADGRVVVRSVVQARNLTPGRPTDRFRLDPEDFLAADRAARAAGREVVGIWHTHPNHPPTPSQRDLDAAWDGYSYLILGVDPLGSVAFRSWRLADDSPGLGARGGRFVEEEIVVEDPWELLP